MLPEPKLGGRVPEEIAQRCRISEARRARRTRTIRGSPSRSTNRRFCPRIGQVKALGLHEAVKQRAVVVPEWEGEERIGTHGAAQSDGVASRLRGD